MAGRSTPRSGSLTPRASPVKTIPGASSSPTAANRTAAVRCDDNVTQFCDRRELAARLEPGDAAVADSKYVIDYYRLSADNRLLFGGGESYRPSYPRDIAGIVRHCMLRVFPQLEDVAIDYAWGGTLAITLRRLPAFGRLDGDEGFAEVFFDEAFLADDAVLGGVVLGDVGAGWRVAMATTGSERGLTLRSPGRFLATAERLLALVAAVDGRDVVENSSQSLAKRFVKRKTDSGSGSVAVDGSAGGPSGAAGLATGSDVVARDGSATASASAGSALWGRAVDAWMHAEAYDLHTLATVTRLAAGDKPGAEASLTKLWWSELDVALHEVALDALGPAAEVEGPWSKGWQFSLSGPIYAGTNEIQRNITAERLLGLPRA